MQVTVVEGDLLKQDVDAIVNAWNRNVIPWWLLWPQGVAGQIRKHAGTRPFRELARHGAIPLGGAVATSAGRLPHKAIIHVAGISLFWVASEQSIRRSVRSAVDTAARQGLGSIAFPLIGAGVGGGGEDRVLAMMADELETLDYDGEVRLVRFVPG